MSNRQYVFYIRIKDIFKDRLFTLVFLIEITNDTLNQASSKRFLHYKWNIKKAIWIKKENGNAGY